MLRGEQKVLAVTNADDRLVGIVDRADLLRTTWGPAHRSR
jgi:CBS-domain-containing membrane protein